MFEWDEEEGRWTAVHHPFTRPTDEWRGTFTDDPGTRSPTPTDLIVNGNELGGGSFRIHEPDIQEQVFGLLALSPDDQRAKFGFLLDALAMGAPPHGGIALGIDRTTMVLAGEANLRDVVAFPKNQAGLDPMSGAPSPITDQQLAELGPPRRRAPKGRRLDACGRRATAADARGGRTARRARCPRGDRAPAATRPVRRRNRSALWRPVAAGTRRSRRRAGPSETPSGRRCGSSSRTLARRDAPGAPVRGQAADPLGGQTSSPR
jgi:hypothetical protein